MVFSILFILFISSILYAFLRHGAEPLLPVFAAEAFLEAFFQAKGQDWLHLVQVPVAVLSALFLNVKPFVVLVLLQPLLHGRELLSPGRMDAMELLGLVFLTSLPVSLYLYKLKGRMRSYDESFNELQSRAKELADNAPSFNDDTLVSRYLTDLCEVEDDIRGLLGIAEKAIVADAVSLFTSDGGDLSCRLSSAGAGVVTRGDGLIYTVFRSKVPLLHFSESPGKDISPGYTRDEEIATLIAVPVMEDSSVLGVLSADSSRYRAFDQQDIPLMELVARETAKTLKRQRVYSQIQLSYNSLRILHEESAPLARSLELSALCTRIVESAERVSGGNVVFLLKKGRSYEIMTRGAKPLIDKRVASLKGTLLEMVQANKDPIYHPDVSAFKTRALPFHYRGVKSVLALPVLHGQKIKGILTVLSERKNAFNSLQINLLEILVNQASVSISNVLLHEEIKAMAFTDGLTGLFNHRHFKERLKEELRRSERFNEALSLMLADIDHFKKVNDTYGHPVGDVVLREVAGLISRTVRGVDVPARYGGEEFAVLMLKTDTRGAWKIAERVRKAIKAHEFKADGH
ncbi:MAG: diguanylate cyclase, partial [Nitrospirae bacterium]|nr:diguanylate cyclase [Nitrospirota bacterium]